MGNLRKILKSGTSEAHARLDKALVEHDLTTQHGLSAYLNVHILARRHLVEAYTRHDTANDVASGAISDLRSDLEILEFEELKWDNPDNIRHFHPLGLNYVIAGSSLGSKVLYKRWSRTTDTRVKRAGNFMTRAKDSSDWLAFLAHIDGVEYPATELDVIVRAANDCFAVFELANAQVVRSH